MKLKTLVIGSGPSAWAVLNSISNLEDVYLIDGGSSVRVDSAKITIGDPFNSTFNFTDHSHSESLFGL